MLVIVVKYIVGTRDESAIFNRKAGFFINLRTAQTLIDSLNSKCPLEKPKSLPMRSLPFTQ